ncbi:MAG: polysulfide reductase NrfD [Anaerolineales bacterium]|nr:polysulfide reductase NrfD [Anaerolineales bacterium]
MAIRGASLRANASTTATELVWPAIRRFDILLGVLGFLTLAGVVAGVGRLLLGLGATTGLSDVYSWGIWIGFDFGLIAFAGAGFTMAAVVHVFHREHYHAALWPAILAGLMGYTAVLALLVLDLGRPDHFYNFILYWNVHSPLFEISCCVLFYTTVLVLETSPNFLGRLKWRWINPLLKGIRWMMLPVTIIGVTLSTLHQSTLGTLYLNMPHRLHPLWWTPFLPILFYLSSIMAGLSLATLAPRCHAHFAPAGRLYSGARPVSHGGGVRHRVPCGQSSRSLVGGRGCAAVDRVRGAAVVGRVGDRRRGAGYAVADPAIAPIQRRAMDHTKPGAGWGADESLRRHPVRTSRTHGGGGLYASCAGVDLNGWHSGRGAAGLDHRYTLLQR